jgi:hypothetical protein
MEHGKIPGYWTDGRSVVFEASPSIFEIRNSTKRVGDDEAHGETRINIEPRVVWIPSESMRADAEKICPDAEIRCAESRYRMLVDCE